MRVLRGIHQPATTNERDWAIAYRNWAWAVLRAIAPERPSLPAPRLIKTPNDAEEVARDVLAALGFEGVAVTPPGRDGGVDVRGRTIVAQVKLEGIKTDAPRVQALSGIAAHEGKMAAYFSLGGYTTAALAWAEEAAVALFEFDYSGEVSPRSSAARALMSGSSP